MTPFLKPCLTANVVETLFAPVQNWVIRYMCHFPVASTSPTTNRPVRVESQGVSRMHFILSFLDQHRRAKRDASFSYIPHDFENI